MFYTDNRVSYERNFKTVNHQISKRNTQTIERKITFVINDACWDNYDQDALFELMDSHPFLQLCDIRGYENLVYDMADEDENFKKLINMIEQFNLSIINKYLDLGVDMMGYAEDLGMQNAPMISPTLFKEYIKPSYTRLMQPAKDKGVMIHMHSDGHLHDLIDDIIGSGVEVINLQDLVNGIDWIKSRFSEKVCIDLDIDRQFITTKGTPEQIDALVREEVEKFSSKEGGLMMIYGLYPSVPLENVKALMDAMERYAFYY